jgi:hypothetical protein
VLLPSASIGLNVLLLIGLYIALTLVVAWVTIFLWKFGKTGFQRTQLVALILSFLGIVSGIVDAQQSARKHAVQAVLDNLTLQIANLKQLQQDGKFNECGMLHDAQATFDREVFDEIQPLCTYLRGVEKAIGKADINNAVGVAGLSEFARVDVTELSEDVVPTRLERLVRSREIRIEGAKDTYNKLLRKAKARQEAVSALEGIEKFMRWWPVILVFGLSVNTAKFVAEECRGWRARASHQREN